MSDNALADTPFNHKACTVPGYEDCWVRFKTSGYPKRLRREWDSAGSNLTLEIITRYIEAWQMRDLQASLLEFADVRSNAIERAEMEKRADDMTLTAAERTKARKKLDGLPDALGDVEDAVIIWLIRTFKDFWLAELTAPRKN